MKFETILYEVEDRIATITFNRPDQLNAISPQMVGELRARLRGGRGRRRGVDPRRDRHRAAFCAGADVGEIPDDGRVIYAEPYLSTYPQWEAPQEATPPFRSMTKPVITAVNGICCGAGLDLLTTGDIVDRVRARRVLRSAREHRPGLGPRVGPARPRAAAQRRDARRADGQARADERAARLRARPHLRDRPARRLLARAREIAALVNRNAPLAVRGTRLAIRKGLDLPLHEAEILAEAFRERVLRTDDAKEGPRAFVEKRAPDWKCR